MLWMVAAITMLTAQPGQPAQHMTPIGCPGGVVLEIMYDADGDNIAERATYGIREGIFATAHYNPTDGTFLSATVLGVEYRSLAELEKAPDVCTAARMYREQHPAKDGQ